MSYLLYMNLNYSINSLLSPHSTYNFFCFLFKPCFFEPKTFFSISKPEGFSLQASCTLMKICLIPFCRDDAITWKKKSYPRRKWFLIFKNEILVVKNILPCRDEIFFIKQKNLIRSRLNIPTRLNIWNEINFLIQSASK